MSNITRNRILTFFIVLSVVLGTSAILLSNILLGVLTSLSLYGLFIVIKDITQTKHSLLNNYPLIGRLRWVFEHERSKIQQYFIEDDKNGTPYNREKRSDVYQKSKGESNTTPFGTQLDVYQKGYEFIKHSMYPKTVDMVTKPTVTFGSKFTTKPYTTSIFNISAMSYGSLSDAAVRALNGGAKLGGFFQNTGEGGISPYHLENGGDLCFQIGTGYFGAGKTINGVRYFDEDSFVKNATREEVKMIEIKLSQGAKPGHGGILPAKKNTQEIANIRGVEPGIDVMSPPCHTAFNDPKSMIEFVSKLRQLSGGKPIGIKLCVGDEKEVSDLINTMKKMDMYPDFITVDGGEGGTGAAPLVFTNNIGSPLLDSLIFVNKKLKEVGLRDDIRLIASGKASTSFDIIKLLALGADSVNAARAFMLSLGCIQARECNRNTCPVGIATQNKTLVAGLNPNDKKVRVYNYHKELIHELQEVIGAMGLTTVKQLSEDKIFIRVTDNETKSYRDLYKIYLD